MNGDKVLDHGGSEGKGSKLLPNAPILAATTNARDSQDYSSSSSGLLSLRLVLRYTLVPRGEVAQAGEAHESAPDNLDEGH